MRNQMKGFTLIELMMAVAIIAILSAVLIIGVADYQLKTNDAVARADVHNALAVVVASAY